jgi:hypothetical protein
MKKIIFGFLMLSAIACNKTITPETNLNPSNNTITSGEKNAVTLNRNTKFGCMICGNFTNDERIPIAQSLNIGYVRSTITMTDWTGRYVPYETYVNNGVKVVLNIGYAPQTGTPVAFPTDLTTYRKKFKEILDKYQPEVVVVENEEINPNYHKGPMIDYMRMLKVAIDVCHSKGIKVTNGGVYGVQLEVLTYQYLQTKGQSRADSFSNNCMDKSLVKSIQNKQLDPSIDFAVKQLDTLLHYYKNLDYVNIHPYEPFDPDVTDFSKVNCATPVVIADFQEYLTARTGKPVMTNETGQRYNTNPDLVTSMLQEYDRLKFPYVLWYSGETIGGSSKSLYDLNTGALYDNGIAFSNFNGSY